MTDLEHFLAHVAHAQEDYARLGNVTLAALAPTHPRVGHAHGTGLVTSAAGAVVGVLAREL